MPPCATIDARSHTHIPWLSLASGPEPCFVFVVCLDEHSLFVEYFDVECLESSANHRMRWNKTLNLTNSRMGVRYGRHLFGGSFDVCPG